MYFQHNLCIWEYKGKSTGQESEDLDANVCGQSPGKKPMIYSSATKAKGTMQQRHVQG